MSRTAAFVSADERANEVQHARLDRRVEAGRGFVEDEQLRVRGERHRDDDALLHPARQLVRVPTHHPLGVGDLDPMERLERLVAGIAPTRPEDAVRLDDLRSDLRRRVERPARVLVDHRGVMHPEAAQFARPYIFVMSSPAMRIRPAVMSPLRGR